MSDKSNIVDHGAELVRHPTARAEMQRLYTLLRLRVDNPNEYIPEAVQDAAHDLLLLDSVFKAAGVDAAQASSNISTRTQS